LDEIRLPLYKKLSKYERIRLFFRCKSELHEKRSPREIRDQGVGKKKHGLKFYDFYNYFVLTIFIMTINSKLKMLNDINLK